MRDVTDTGLPGGKTAPCGTILIVDDASESVLMLEMACASIPGIAISSVASALDAIEVLRDGVTPVCAVLTDIRMPAMNGFDLIRFIRSDARHSAVPIVVISADTAPDTPERSVRLGANAYFSKPFSPAAVRQTLERLLDATRILP